LKHTLYRKKEKERPGLLATETKPTQKCLIIKKKKKRVRVLDDQPVFGFVCDRSVFDLVALARKDTERQI